MFQVPLWYILQNVCYLNFQYIPCMCSRVPLNVITTLWFLPRRTRRQDIRNGDPLSQCSDLQHHGTLLTHSFCLCLVFFATHFSFLCLCVFGFEQMMWTAWEAVWKTGVCMVWRTAVCFWSAAPSLREHSSTGSFRSSMMIASMRCVFHTYACIVYLLFCEVKMF